MLVVEPAVAGSCTRRFEVRPKMRLSEPSLCHVPLIKSCKSVSEFSFALITVFLASAGQLNPSKLLF